MRGILKDTSLSFRAPIKKKGGRETVFVFSVTISKKL